MATKPMKLKCKITLENDHTFTVNSKMYDGTQFKLTANRYEFNLNEDFLPSKRTVDGWIYVEQNSQQGERVYVTLPQPTIEHGRHLVVHALDLMPRYASIEDFKPKDADAVKASMDFAKKPK